MKYFFRFVPAVFTLSGFLLCAADVDKITASDPSTEIRIINYNGTEIPTVDAQLRYNTVIQLPHGERSIEADSGDAGKVGQPGSGHWIVTQSDTGDAVIVRPTQVGLKTNLDILTDHGNRYKFFVIDRSGNTGYHSQLAITLVPSSQGFVDNIKEPPKFVPAAEFNAVKEQAQQFQQQLNVTTATYQQKLTDQQNTARSETLASLVHDFNFDKAKKQPFGVTDIAHDKDFTYIWAKPDELFAVYDLKDGKQDLIKPQYDPKGGYYVIEHLIRRGRIVIGKKSAEFERVS
jgi:hypothetical protein